MIQSTQLKWPVDNISLAHIFCTTKYKLYTETFTDIIWQMAMHRLHMSEIQTETMFNWLRSYIEYQFCSVLSFANHVNLSEYQELARICHQTGAHFLKVIFSLRRQVTRKSDFIFTQACDNKMKYKNNHKGSTLMTQFDRASDHAMVSKSHQFTFKDIVTCLVNKKSNLWKK